MGDVNSKTDGNELCEDSQQFSDEELAMYRQMYLKCCDKMSSKMKRNVFYEKVLGDLFPPAVAEFLFYAFSGGSSDGVSLDNLLRGLHNFSRVTSPTWHCDRVKLLFQVLSSNGNIHSTLNKTKSVNLFRTVEDQVRFDGVKEFIDKFHLIEYDLFSSWATQNADYFSFLKWLLCHETVPGFQLPCSTAVHLFAVPTLYSTIAKITHLDEREIALLEKHFFSLCAQSKMALDFPTFHALVCPPIAEEVTLGFFNAFDSNGDANVDFNEYVCGLSACCRGPQLERRKFLFRMFDFDGDGMLSKAEIFNLVDICVRMQYQFSQYTGLHPFSHGANNCSAMSMNGSNGHVAGSSARSHPALSQVFLDSQTIIDEIMRKHDPDFDSFIQPDDFLIWASNTSVLDVFCDLLEQICHVVFGLKPLTPEHEGTILKKFIKREKSLLNLGSKWFVIPQNWWLSWIEHTTYSNYNSNEDTVSMNNFTVGVNKTIPHLTQNNGGGYKSNSAASSPLRTRKAQKLNGSWRKREHHYTVNPLPEDMKPLGAIDTSKLISRDKPKAPQLTSQEILKFAEADSKHECIPHAVWRCLVTWYGSSGPPIERVVVRDHGRQKGAKVETHPMVLNLYQHAQKSPSLHSILSQQMSATIGAALTITSPVLSATTVGVGGVNHLAPLLPPLTNSNQNNNTATASTMVTNNYSGQNGSNNTNGSSSLSPPSSSSQSNQSQSSNNSNQSAVSFKRSLTKTLVLSQDTSISEVRALLMNKFNVRSEDMRLWHLKSEDCLIMLTDISTTLFEAGVCSGDNLLMELRQQPSGQWPEALIEQHHFTQAADTNSLYDPADDTFDTGSKTSLESNSNTRAGQAGLHNIGNTCFMNSALQCMSHTYALTSYFLKERHFYELNMKSQDGSQGQVALCYGHLLEQLWSENTSVVKPAVIRDCIVKHRSQFNNSNQHDAQEMLEAVLDLLHEDLNRVVEPKKYQTLSDAEGRSDYDVAEEQWTAHIQNNNSVICDLFTGQMQTSITCSGCSRSTSKFDVFNVLSLSIPSDQMVIVYVLLQKLDGTPPMRYALRVPRQSTYSSLKTEFAPLCNLTTEEIMFFETTNNRLMLPTSVPGPQIEDNLKLKNHSFINSSLMAFQRVASGPFSQAGSSGSHPDTPLLETPSVSNDSLALQTNGINERDEKHEFLPKGHTSNTPTQSSFDDENSHSHNPTAELSSSISCQTKINQATAKTKKTESSPNNGQNKTSESNTEATEINSEADVPTTTSLYISAPQEQNLVNGDQNLPNGQEASRSSVDSGVHVTQNSGCKTDCLSPVPNISLTPSSSGYASSDTTWKTSTETTNQTALHSSSSSLFLFAIHCKQTPNQAYFLWQNRTRSTLFGRPLLVPLSSNQGGPCTNADVYSQVEAQVSRFVTSSPSGQHQNANHAKDCDEILTGSGSYPFTLRKVAIVPNYSTQNNNNNNSVNNVNSSNLFQNGSNFSNNQPFSLKCWTCPWYNICKGCPLELSEDIFEPPPNLQSLVNDGGTNSNSSSSTNHNGAQNGVGGGVKNVNGSGGGASCFPSSTVYVLAIEWEPTIIHLRFNFAAENEVLTHPNVEKVETLHKQPLNLDDCMSLLTKDQIISDFSPCPKCQNTKIALKQVQL